MPFDLDVYERLCYSRQTELAARELFSLLQEFDSNYGNPSATFSAHASNAVLPDEREIHVWTRAAAATTALLTEPSLQISPEWQTRLLQHHRWLSALFSATPLVNLDAGLRSLSTQDVRERENLVISTDNVYKLCLMYSAESEVPLDLDALWEARPVYTASLCLALLSPRFMGPSAHAKRETLLPWLAKKLPLIEDVESLPVGVLHDAYMHCSYADRADKHDIKRSINTLLVRKLRQHGLEDSTRGLPPQSGSDKPVLLVVLEWFTSSHSIYRTHSLTLEAARERFHLVGMAYSNCIDAVTSKVFDEVIHIDGQVSMLDQLRQIRGVAEQKNASVLYMPSVGMFPLTMWLCNLRIAPLQLMALGHPATTHSHAIDRVVVEADYVGDPACFSEALLELPPDGMPYRAPTSMQTVDWDAPVERVDEGRVVRIAVCATTMKLNPRFFQACQQIRSKSKTPVHFVFLVGQATGVVYPAVVRAVKQFLGADATVHPHQNYAGYIATIRSCDMFLNPFPFGNTNGIVDTVAAGLVGVCLSGPEVHEHIDEGLFNRLGFPEWMIATTLDEYVEAAARLVNDAAERVSLGAKLSGRDAVQKIFAGRPEVFAELLALMLRSMRASQSKMASKQVQSS